MDTIEEIIRLKALLDKGAITEDEFNSLKKHLMSNSQVTLTDQNSDKIEVGKKSSVFKKVSIVIGVAIILTVSIFGFAIPDKSKEIIQNMSNIFKDEDEQEDGYLYEEGEKIGKIVKFEIRGNYPHSMGGATPLNIPQGKMWTPLYYEQISGNRDLAIVQFFYKLRSGYSYNDYFEFEVTKSRFVSAKHSKQNNDALSWKDQMAVIITSYAKTGTSFAIYFLEESY